MIQYLITALIDIAVGILAFSKKGNPAAKALSFTVFSLSAWSLELFLLTVIKNETVLSILFHITRWGMFFIPATFALLAWRLVGSRSTTFKRLFVIPGFVMSCALSISNTFFFPSTLKIAEGGYLPVIDTIFYLFFISFTWCFLGSIGVVFASFKSSSSREKQRLKWLIITLCVSFFGGVLGMYSMPSGFYLSKFLGAITNIVFVVLLFYSTIQHNLMDFRLALSLSLSKAMLLGFFVWLYFVVTSVVGDHTESTGGILILLIFVVLILEAYPRLLRWILPSAKKMFVKHGYDFDQVKEDAERSLNNTMTFPVMFEVLDHLFLKVLRVDSYKILMIQNNSVSNINRDLEHPRNLPLSFLPDSNPLVSYCLNERNILMADEMPEPIKEEMEAQGAALCFPVTSNNKTLGLVLVGPMSTLSYYRYDDIKIFEWLANELGQVLQRLIRLEQMQDQLGEAKKTLSMLDMMSHYHHDIKAPFAIIDGILSNDIYDRDKQKDIVLEQVERGSRLIATMASILGGKRRRRVRPCEIEAIIKDCLFVFEQSIDKVEYQLEKIPKIAGDAEDLKILFINLIKNSIEARRGTDDLIVTARSWLKDGDVYIAIKDNGVGMPESQLINIWDQGDSTKPFGNGIGMQAIKRIADEHNARIDVYSEVDKGTEFIICFPSALIVKEDKPLDEASKPDELSARRTANNS